MSQEQRDPLDAAQVAMLRQLATAAGPSFLDGLISTFVDRGQQLLAELTATDDPVAVAAASHELKGSASTIGAALVAERARTIEQGARAGRTPESAEIAALADELARAAEALRGLV